MLGAITAVIGAVARTSPAPEFVPALVLITAQTSQREGTTIAGVYFAHNLSRYVNLRGSLASSRVTSAQLVILALSDLCQFRHQTST